MISLTQPNPPKISRNCGFVNARILSPGLELDSGGLVIQDGKILELGNTEEIQKRYAEKCELWDAGGFTVIPGLINAHSHVAMGFFRDLVHGHQNPIEGLMFPFESNLSTEVVEPLSYASIYEGLLGGITCFVDHYYFIEGVSRALVLLGARGVVSECINDHLGPLDGKAAWKRARQTIENWPFGTQVIPAVGPHASDTTSPDMFRELSTFARNQGLPLHFHLSQTDIEKKRAKENFDKTPVQLAESYGALQEQSLVIHMINVDNSDLNLIRTSGATIGFCPTSQMIYARLAPIEKFLEKKLKIAIGTDCAAANDQTDMLSEMKTAALMILDRTQRKDSQISDAVFQMSGATVAECMGLRCGKIEKGYEADLVFLSEDLLVQPVQRPLHNLIYSMNSRNVRHVMVGGEWSVYQSKLTRVVEQDLQKEFLAACQTMQKRISAS